MRKISFTIFCEGEFIIFGLLTVQCVGNGCICDLCTQYMWMNLLFIGFYMHSVWVMAAVVIYADNICAADC